MISLIALVNSLAILALTLDSIPTLHSQTMMGMLCLREVRLLRPLFSRNVTVGDCTAAPSLAWKCHDIEPQPAQCAGRPTDHPLDFVTRRAGTGQSRALQFLQRVQLRGLICWDTRCSRRRGNR